MFFIIIAFSILLKENCFLSNSSLGMGYARHAKGGIAQLAKMK